MTQIDDLSRSLVAFEQDSTLVAVVEMSQSSWLVAGLVPGVTRQPLKKLEPGAESLLRLIERWRSEATKAGRRVARVVLAYEAGRDGFWLAPHGSSPWAEGSRLRARAIETYIIHPTSIPVSREHKRAKTDRLDTAMLLRAVLGCPSTSSGARRAQALLDGGARWRRYRRSRKRTPSVRAASARGW